MAALQCEICGGKLVGKPGGLFECEYCGMEYNTDWAKAKIQEIKGTVKVEGTVEVKGTVKLDTADKAKVLLQHAKEEIRKKFPPMGRSSSEREKINEQIEKLLVDVLLESPKEYWVFLFKSLKNMWKKDEYQTIAELTEEQIGNLEKDPNWLRALEYAPAQTGENLLQMLQKRKNDLVDRMNRFDQVLEVNRDQIAMLETRVKNLNKRILFNTGNIVAHTTSGDVFISFRGKEPMLPVRNVIQVIHGYSDVTCLHGDGTVTVVEESETYKKNWTGIIRLCEANGQLIGITEEGSLCTEWSNIHKYTKSWKDVVEIEYIQATGYGAMGCLLGITESGEIKETTPGICKQNCKFVNINEAEHKLIRRLSIRKNGAQNNSMSLDNDSNRKKMWNLHGVLSVAHALIHDYLLTTDGRIWQSENGQYLQGKYSQEIPVVYVASDGWVLLLVYEDGTMEIQSRFQKPAEVRIGDWKLFDSIHTIDQEWNRFMTRIEEERAEEERRRQEEHQKLLEEKRQKLLTEKETLQTELTTLRGLFTGKRRKEIETRLAEIETELKGQ